ncbi:helix-turn-helix domain-containing protein [Agrobacterium vitis]|nr:helix-turn-helix domain-containing protein [Agrobacterium vitis]
MQGAGQPLGFLWGRKAMHTYLAEWRRYRGYGQKRLAAIAQVSLQTISNIENQRRGFSSETLERIANALGCSTTHLVAVNPLDHRSIFLRSRSPEAIERELRQATAIFKSLATLVETYPQRVPQAAAVAQRLADHSRSHPEPDM